MEQQRHVHDRGRLTLRALEPAELVTGASPVGLFTLGAAPPAVPVPTLEWLRDGPDLVVPPPGGDPVADPDLAGRVAAELAAALGGPFAEVAGHVAVAVGLAAPQQLAAYGIPADPTRFGFVGVTLEPEEPGWRAQVLAVAGGPYLVSLVHPLAEAAAVGPGGHPVRRPLGDPQPLVRRLLPGLRLPDDRSADHDAALYDAVLAGPQGRVRCGVRRLTGPDGDPPPMPCGYVLRADIPAP